MTDAPSAPATKQDIAMLMDMLGQMMIKMTGMEDRMTGMEDRMDGLEQKIDDVEQRMLVQFENLKHDVLGALKDVRTNDTQIADHERPIVRLEHAAAAR